VPCQLKTAYWAGFMNYCRNIVKLNFIFAFNNGPVMAQLPLANPLRALYNPHSFKNGTAFTQAVKFNNILSIIP
jgi:hypothetical protein